jgi:RimJ/RimL family protein N-acetyltransferase
VKVFETSRLIGQVLSLDDYADFESGREPFWVGFTNPYKHLIEGPNPLRFRIPRVTKDPSFAEIALVLAVTKDYGEVIGSSGFHDFPDEHGVIEVGYGIVPQKQNQGYGKEFLLGTWKWIAERQDVKILRYTVSPRNEVSLHIIRSLGFDQFGEQEDPDDGIELIFEQSVDNFLANNF